FLEAARVLGEKLQTQHGGDAKSLVSAAFRLVTSHQINAQQEAVLTALLDDAGNYYKQHEQEAADLLAQTGEYPRLATVSATDAAAATTLIRTLLSYDEFIMKR
ncbi:MAG: hypothetical protein WCN98_17400, partial [Verrucomicrobiaceae bacterium]